MSDLAVVQLCPSTKIFPLLPLSLSLSFISRSPPLLYLSSLIDLGLLWHVRAAQPHSRAQLTRIQASALGAQVSMRVYGMGAGVHLLFFGSPKGEGQQQWG